MAHNVIDIQEITPEEVSSSYKSNTSGWWVNCEGGCGLAFCVRRISWRPTDWTKGYNEATPVIEVRLLQPPAKRCDKCTRKLG